MSGVEVEVIKLGGSLVSRRDFVPAVCEWLEQQQASRPEDHRVLLVGGGPLVETLRQLDALRAISASDAHWRAIELMQVTGRMVAGWLPAMEVVESFCDLRRRCAQPGQTLLLPERFLMDDEPNLEGDVLEEGWHVTSDSIAARLAICLGAARLRLIKSRRPAAAEANDWALAAQNGLVDRFFPRLAQRICHVSCDLLPSTTHFGD